MLIGGTSATAYTQASGQSANSGAGTSALGQDAFMKLLLAELQNQDPMKPMEDKDFIAQLATFNSLSELSTMNKTMAGVQAQLDNMTALQTVAQGSAMIGKTVTAVTADGGAVTGVVSKLFVQNGTVMLQIGDKTAPLNSVSAIEGESPSETSEVGEQP